MQPVETSWLFEIHSAMLNKDNLLDTILHKPYSLPLIILEGRLALYSLD